MRAVLCLLVFICAPTMAVEMVPLSYVATPGDMGWYPWYDETNRQLTDGAYGGPSPNEPGFPG